MEEPEVPIEHVQEHIEHHAKHSSEGWVSKVALSTAILAAFAAVSSLLAGSHANEAMIDQIKASDVWNYYQAKGIKAEVVGVHEELLKFMGQPVDKTLAEQHERDANKQKQSMAEAREREQSAAHHLEQHEIFARAVTMFQIAIAVGAISVLTKRPMFWGASLAFGAVGLFFIVQGFISKPEHLEANSAPKAAVEAPVHALGE